MAYSKAEALLCQQRSIWLWSIMAMVFPVVMYGCESSTIRRAERRRIDAFELWCWRRLLRVPWTARRSNQSILKEISPGCSLEGLMLKPKLQYFGHLMWRADSFEKTLMLGKIEGRRRRGRQRMKWLDGITDQWTWVWVDSGSWWWTGRPGVLQFMGLQRVRHDWATELNWTERLNPISLTEDFPSLSLNPLYIFPVCNFLSLFSAITQSLISWKSHFRLVALLRLKLYFYMPVWSFQMDVSYALQTY